jgi:hypothetical protein
MADNEYRTFTGHGSDGFDINAVPDSVEIIADPEDFGIREEGAVEVTQVGFIDLTPRGCTTPEGIERTNKAMHEFEDSAVAVANAAMRFVHNHEFALVEMVVREQDASNIREDFAELRELVRARRVAQDEFLRAVSGQPPAPTE